VEGGRTKGLSQTIKETKENLRCLFANIRSIRAKIDELRYLAEVTQADLILLTETWTNPDMGDAEITIEGFTILSRSDRQDTAGGRGGGIISYIRTEVIASDVESSFDQFCQARLIQINCHHMKLNVVNVYRPPSTTQENTAKLCNALREINGPSIIVGDFNFPEINWNTLTTTNARSQDFLDATQEMFFSQMVNFSTRSGNTLDLLLCTHPEIIEDIVDIGPIGNSDHTCIQFEIKVTSQKKGSNQMIPDFRKANFDDIREDFGGIKWDVIFNGKGTEEMWNTFKQKLEQVVLKNVPFMQRRARKKIPWSNQETKRLINVKRRKYKKMKCSESTEDVKEFKKAQQQVKKSVRRARKNYERNLAKNFKNNPKPFYCYISRNSKTKSLVGPLKCGDQVTQSDAEVCDVLNNFFTSVFTKDDSSELPYLDQKYTGNFPLQDIIINESDVLRALSKVKIDSAPGPDKIYSRVLMELQHQVAYPLALIYQSSLETATVVSDWRVADVTPVFKKGSKCNANNYRPISLTSVPGKIMERILREAIMDHLQKNNLILPTQHGFLPKKSTVSNLIEYLEEITSMLDAGLPVDAVYIDYAKCFDKISHRHLLFKISRYGITGKIISWLRNWLKNRKQRVCLNGVTSAWADVTSSVIQGSILGPMLFTIYSNDIDKVLKTSKISKYADDSKVFAKVVSMEDHVNLQVDLDNVFDWSVKWKMEMNKEKCHIIHFGSNNKGMGYSLGDENLETVEEEKDLGVIIHKSGKPHQQCSKAAKKANQVLGQLCRNVISKDKITFTRLYKTYVRPHLEYAIQVWNPWNVGDVDLLEKVQRRATRQISGIGKLPYEERLKILGLTSLQERRKRGDMIELHKMINGITNVQLGQIFKSVNQDSQMCRTRGALNQNLFKQHTRLEVRKNFFTQRVINGWNELPVGVKNSATTLAFKINYDKYMSLQL